MDEPEYIPTLKLRRNIRYVFEHATRDEAGWAISGSIALAVIEVATGFFEGVPSHLLPTVVTLTLTLLLAAPPIMDLIPERWRLTRQSLRILGVLLLVNVVAITIAVAQATHRQGQRASAACLQTVAHLEQKANKSDRPALLLGGALCQEIAAEHS